MSRFPISVVAVNYNGSHVLRPCLESLLAQDYPDFEMIVVDNASVDGSRDVVKQYPKVKWIGFSQNKGLAAGYNAGAREARGEKMFFINNDMKFEKNCLRQLAEGFDSEDIFAMDPLQMDWNGRGIIHGAQRFHRGWNHWRYAVPLLNPYQDFMAEKKTEVSWGGGGALMVDRKKFEALGGFDPTFFVYFEDVDLCWRAWLRDWKTVFDPKAIVYHKVGASHDAKLKIFNPYFKKNTFHPVNARIELSQCKNAQRFVMKTMPASMVALTIFSEGMKGIGTFLCGNFQRGSAHFQALFLNIRELPEILKERQAIRRQAKTTSSALLDRWGNGQL